MLSRFYPNVHVKYTHIFIDWWPSSFHLSMHYYLFNRWKKSMLECIQYEKLLDLWERMKESEREREKMRQLLKWREKNELTTYKYNHEYIEIQTYVLVRNKINSKLNLKNESIIQRVFVMVISQFTFSFNSAFVYLDVYVNYKISIRSNSNQYYNVYFSFP